MLCELFRAGLRYGGDLIPSLQRYSNTSTRFASLDLSTALVQRTVFSVIRGSYGLFNVQLGSRWVWLFVLLIELKCMSLSSAKWIQARADRCGRRSS